MKKTYNAILIGLAGGALHLAGLPLWACVVLMVCAVSALTVNNK